MTLEITVQNYELLVLNSQLPVILDFWAPRCGPCNQLSPHLNELALEYGDRVIIGKINVDENSDLLLKYNIRSIPAILYLKDGEIVNKLIGYSSKKVLENNLKSYLL
jgi:thioredoxin 1